MVTVVVMVFYVVGNSQFQLAEDNASSISRER